MASLTALAKFSPLNCGQRWDGRPAKEAENQSSTQPGRASPLHKARRRTKTQGNAALDGRTHALPVPKVTQTNTQRPSRPGRRFKRSVRIIAMKVSLKVLRKTLAFGCGSVQSKRPANWGQNPIISKRLDEMGGQTGSLIFLITKRGAVGGGCEEKRRRGEQKGSVVTFYSVAAPTVLLCCCGNSTASNNWISGEGWGVFVFSPSDAEQRDEGGTLTSEHQWPSSFMQPRWKTPPGANWEEKLVIS